MNLECNTINVENLLTRGWKVSPEDARELARVKHRDKVSEGARFMSDAFYIADQIAKEEKLEENPDYDPDAEEEDDED